MSTCCLYTATGLSSGLSDPLAILSDESEGRGVPSDSDILAILSNASATRSTTLTSEKLRKIQKDAQRQQQQQQRKKTSSFSRDSKSHDTASGSSLSKSQAPATKASQSKPVYVHCMVSIGSDFPWPIVTPSLFLLCKWVFSYMSSFFFW